MTLCAVCQCPCRGQCGKCGARLCAAHKPTRSGCAICRQRSRTNPPASAPSLLPPAPNSLPLASLPLPEQLQRLTSMREQLVQKRARERAYLDRRAARGTHTPTDDAYEADQILEGQLLEVLDLCAAFLSDMPSGGTNAYMRLPQLVRHASSQPKD